MQVEKCAYLKHSLANNGNHFSKSTRPAEILEIFLCGSQIRLILNFFFLLYLFETKMLGNWASTSALQMNSHGFLLCVIFSGPPVARRSVHNWAIIRSYAWNKAVVASCKALAQKKYLTNNDLNWAQQEHDFCHSFLLCWRVLRN